MARASILWLVGEYAERVPKIAPDVLRMAAKSFIKEVCNHKKTNKRRTTKLNIDLHSF
jgi:AP-3 complex subunit beta